MAATPTGHAADVPDELTAWWRTFNNGSTVDDEEEDEDDSEGEEETDREDKEVREEGASAAAAAATKVDQQRTSEASCTEKDRSSASAFHGDDAEEITVEDSYVLLQHQAGLLGRKREAVATRTEPQAIGIEIQDAEDAGEEIPEDNYAQIGRIEPIMTRSKLKATGTEVQDRKGEEIPGDTNVQLQGWRREAIMTRSKLWIAGIENHNHKEDKISENTYVEPEGGLRGRKRKATPSKLQTTGTEIQDKKDDGECLRAENEMLRRQLLCKTKELETEQIQRLKLKLNVRNKEIKSLKKHIGELRAEIEHCRKTAKLPRKPRLCGFCNEYVLGHNYRNCPKSSASSERDEGDHSI